MSVVGVTDDLEVGIIEANCEGRMILRDIFVFDLRITFAFEVVVDRDKFIQKHFSG